MRTLVPVTERIAMRDDVLPASVEKAVPTDTTASSMTRLVNVASQ